VLLEQLSLSQSCGLAYPRALSPKRHVWRNTSSKLFHDFESSINSSFMLPITRSLRCCHFPAGRSLCYHVINMQIGIEHLLASLEERQSKNLKGRYQALWAGVLMALEGILFSWVVGRD
jgi:hypothetical protein